MVSVESTILAVVVFTGIVMVEDASSLELDMGELPKSNVSMRVKKCISSS
jgi:hypothetical protein